MFNDYAVMKLADARHADLLREAEAERLVRTARASKGSKSSRPSLVVAAATGGAVLAALLIAVIH